MTERAKYILSMFFAAATVAAAWVGFGLITTHLIMLIP